MREEEADAPTTEEQVPHYVFCTYCGDSAWACRDVGCPENEDHQSDEDVQCYLCGMEE
jgi:hypothetical protein